MITVFGGGTSRSLRVAWLLEEMGLPYAIRPVDLLSGVEDAEFLDANPAGYIPVLRDGDVTMVESIAMMEYLMARHGPTPLAPSATDPAFPAYQQFLHLGEAGLAALMMVVVVSGFLAPEDQRDNWGATWARANVGKRLGLVSQRLQQTPYMAGDRFTAADISVAYALRLGRQHRVFELGERETGYLERMLDREACRRALAASAA